MGRPRFYCSKEVENAVMDVLMEGPASALDVALEINVSKESTRRCIKNLQAMGLVETWGMVANGSARPMVHYQLTRTRPSM